MLENISKIEDIKNLNIKELEELSFDVSNLIRSDLQG